MWYSVSVFLKSDAGGQESFWEEQIILVNAECETTALEFGEEWGRRHESEYVAASGHDVRWSFERVERVCEIEDDTLATGTELFSRFMRAAEARSLLTPFD
jgi:hypothetical protein